MATRRPAAAAAKQSKDAANTTVADESVATFVVPDLSIKELLSCIPSVLRTRLIAVLYSLPLTVNTASSVLLSGPCPMCMYPFPMKRLG